MINLSGITYESISSCNSLLDFLVGRLKKHSPHIKYKVRITTYYSSSSFSTGNLRPQGGVRVKTVENTCSTCDRMLLFHKKDNLFIGFSMLRTMITLDSKQSFFLLTFVSILFIYTIHYISLVKLSLETFGILLLLPIGS